MYYANTVFEFEFKFATRPVFKVFHSEIWQTTGAISMAAEPLAKCQSDMTILALSPGVRDFKLWDLIKRFILYWNGVGTEIHIIIMVLGGELLKQSPSLLKHVLGICFSSGNHATTLAVIY